MDTYCSHCNMILESGSHDNEKDCINALGQRVNFLTQSIAELVNSTKIIVLHLSDVLNNEYL